MKIIKLLCSTALLAGAVAAHAQIPVQMESFSVNDVTLTESAFKHAEDMDIRYLLGIDPDRLLAPYLKEAGLEPRPTTTRTGRTPDWTATSEVIIFLRFHTCTHRLETLRSKVVSIM